MTSTAVVRLYGVAFAAVLAVVSFLQFTTPVASPRPAPAQQALYANVPTVDPGPPPRAAGVREGEALAYIRVPRFGADWLWVVSEGTGMDVLADGPGHFVASALPGQAGNTAYAGHRSGHGDPFLEFEDLRPGDRVVVAQNGGEWTYEVLFEPRVIGADELWVVQQDLGWGRPRLTLVTCWPKYGSEKRYFVRAALVEDSSAG